MTPLTRVPTKVLQRLQSEPTGWRGFNETTAPSVRNMKHAWGATSPAYKGHKVYFEELKKYESITIVRAFFAPENYSLTPAQLVAQVANGGGTRRTIVSTTAYLELWLGEWINTAKARLPDMIEVSPTLCPFEVLRTTTDICVYSEDMLYHSLNLHPCKIKRMFECMRHGGFIPRQVVPEFANSTRLTESWAILP